jgi:cation:H+ antiporter
VNLLTLGLFLVGIGVLVGGAEALVRGAGRLATALGVRPLVVGLTVVAFGTSAPELAVGVGAAFAGQPDIALGNVVGSNIANILLVLGLASLVTPVEIAPQVVRREVPVMIAASLALWLLAAGGSVSRLDGVLLVGAIAAYTLYQVRASRRASVVVRAEYAAEFGAPPARSAGAVARDLAMIVAGLVALVIGAAWIVDGAVEIASALGVPEVIVGLTIVAVGTSLPEIATSVTAGLRGHRDIAVGNVVGSCIFNILMVLGCTAAVAPAPIEVSRSLLAVDVPLMVASALACLPILYVGRTVTRAEGALLLAFYAAYLGYLGLVASGGEAAAAFGNVLIFGAVPVAGIVLVVHAWREWRTGRRARAARHPVL